jgi:hypothetical protein
VDVYDGGFPFGIHYQSPALLLDAALIKLGFSPVLATNGLGIAALLAAPILFAWAADRAGVRPLASVAGAVVVATVAPEHPMVGGWESYLGQGLLSQAVTIPILIVCGSVIVSGPSRWAPWAGAFAAAAHTQVTIMAFGAALLAVLAAGTPEVRRRFFLASAGAAIGAITLYGAGAANFTVPFGAPRAPAWRLMGFAFDRILDGDLLDQDRAPILTVATLCSGAFLLPLVRSRAARGALIFVLATSFVTFGRDAFMRMGGTAYILFGIAPPARMMVVVPLAAALAVAVALHELDVRVEQAEELLASRRWSAGLVRALGRAPLAVCTLAIALPTLWSRWGWMRAELTGFESLSGRAECGAATPRGYSTRSAAEWLRSLDRGRFIADPRSFPDACTSVHGLDLASPLPLGSNVGGPGSQVGVLGMAYASLDVGAKESAARAEAIGVRDVLAARSRAPEGGEWHERAAEGDTILLERTGGTDIVGVGCVVEEWTGSNRALREALMVDIAAEAHWLSEPTSLIAIRLGSGALQRTPIDRGGCDVSGARVVEQKREPGAYEATVTNPSEVDIVIRATYFPTWDVRLDGKPVPKQQVAPGFISARVPAGVHHLEATVALPAGSLLGPLFGCVVLALLARMGRSRATRRAPSLE